MRGTCFSNEEIQIPDQEEADTLLQIQKLIVANVRRKSSKREAVCMWDPGSTLSFITFQLARELGLEGVPVVLEISTVGGEVTKLNSQRYSVSVFDTDGQDVRIDVLGIEKISTDIEWIDMEKVKQLFTNKEVREVDRPESGTLDLLIGFSYAAYHPVKLEAVGHLLLMKNRFGSIIAGSHSSFQEKTKKLVKHAIVLHADATVEDFYSIESLGVTCYPRCGSCRCGKCHTGGKDMTLVEEKEFEMIKSGLIFNHATGKWLANYPWIIDPKHLQNNIQFAFATLMSTEKKLSRDELYAETYRTQMNDMLERNVARKVSEKELKEYSGPKFYIAHHDVLSPQSASTQCE